MKGLVPAGARAWLLVLALAAAAVFAPSAFAQKEARPAVADPALEKRVLAIAEELRCLVCQNETLAASHADLAVDLRRQIERMLLQGQSQQQIIDYMVARYGDFVLYRPPVAGRTLLLWFGPFVLLVGGVAGLVLHIRSRRRNVAEPVQLTPEQARRARLLLDEEEGKRPS